MEGLMLNNQEKNYLGLLNRNWQNSDRLSQNDLWELNIAIETLEKKRLMRWEYATEYHLNTRGKRMTFDDRPYLIKLYKDNSQLIVVRKCVQIGVSEWAICDCFSSAEQGLNVFYVLPKYATRNRFVKRIDKVTRRSKYYRERIGDTDNLWQKEYCGSDIVFASSETPSDFIEYQADNVIIDEYDICDQDNIILAPDRISDSDYKLQRKISTPTYEGVGISLEYDKSDKKQWHVQCEHCRKRQPLDFFTNIVREVGDNRYELIDVEWRDTSGRDIQVYCRKCGKPIDRLSEGEWIAEYPDRNISGYQYSKLFSVQTTIRELYQKFQNAQYDQSKLQVFYNSDLGLPFTAEGDSLTQTFLDECIGIHNMLSYSKNTCKMGVDVGNILHVVITKGTEVVYIGFRSTFDELIDLMKKYKINCCVIDMRPETRKAKEFQSSFRGKVYLAEYINNEKTRMKTIVPDRKKGKVQAHRTQSIDSMVAKLTEGKLKLPKEAKGIENFYSQMQVPKRVIEEKSRGMEAIWTKGTDHYFHAMNYASIAAEVFKPISIDFI